MAFQPAPKPKSNLGYLRILAPTAGVRVSPLCLGAMNFGDAGKAFMGECDKKSSFEILDCFYENGELPNISLVGARHIILNCTANGGMSGGNFIDTANNYQAEESETWIGEWMAACKNRDEIVLATKFTTAFPAGPKGIKANYQGNHSKSLKVSLEASLKKLQTDYIDLLYIHWWDFSTSIPELMQSLHHVVAAGKVLYLGISDTPAWIVSKANQYARDHGLTQFSVYQGHWSAAMRDFERDILPMCEAEGMALAPWGALGRGNFRTAEAFEQEKNEGRKMGGPTEKVRTVSAALEKLAVSHSTAVTSIALAYVMHKAPYVFPIVGGRKIEHLKGNMEALSIQLSDEEINEIEAAVPFEVGFPMSMLFEFGGEQKYSTRMGTGDIALLKNAVHLDDVGKVRPPRVRKE